MAAGGALCAHALAGGTIEPVPGLMVLAVAVPMATVLTRIGTVDVHRLFATALVAQLVGHLTLMMAPSGMQHAGHLGHATTAASPIHALGFSDSMLLTHLAVAGATTAVAAGVDRAAVAAAWSILGWLLLQNLRHGPVPVRLRSVLSGIDRPVLSQTSRTPADPRGPPMPPRLRLHPLRIAL